MVDLAHSFDGSSHFDDTRSASEAPVSGVTVTTGIQEALAIVDTIGPDDICTAYQHPSFLRAWLQHGGAKPVFITVTSDRGGRVLLPLEDMGNGVAGFVGNRHANGNFPVGTPADIRALCASGNALDAIARNPALRSAGIDSIVLERQHTEYQGVANPFVTERSAVSPNVALSATLGCEFDALLERVSGSRKRKKFRNQMRKLEAVGTVELIIPVDQDDTQTTLQRFFELKADRFREAGIANVFSDKPTQAAFHALFDCGASKEPKTHEIHALKVGEHTAAVMGCTTIGKRIIVEFSSFDPAFAHAGPGDLLFFLAIKDACERGFEIFDFGVGDEPFKRSWCDTETWHRDTIIAVSGKGQLIAFARRARTSLVRKLKSSGPLWKLAKAARKKLASIRNG